METFLLIAERLGVPVAILIFLGYCLWRMGRWFGNKILLPVTTSHIALVNEAKDANKTNAQTLVTMAKSSEATGSAIVRIADQHEEQIKLTRQIHDRVVMLRGGDQK